MSGQIITVTNRPPVNYALRLLRWPSRLTPIALIRVSDICLYSKGGRVFDYARLDDIFLLRDFRIEP